MRDQIWAELQDKKFQEIYTDKLAKRAHSIGNAYSFFLVFASSGSVAAWTIWDLVPDLWGTLVAISQFLHLAKSYIPWIKNGAEYAELSHMYGELYLKYEELWYAYERNELSPEEAASKYHEYRKKDHEIMKTTGAIYCPKNNRLVKKCSKYTNMYLQRHH